MGTLNEFAEQIASLKAEAERLPADHDVYQESPCRGASLLCGDLAYLSREIRSICWRDRGAARMVAHEADAACDAIASRFGLVGGGQLPIKGSVGTDATGSYNYGGRY